MRKLRILMLALVMMILPCSTTQHELPKPPHNMPQPLWVGVNWLSPLEVTAYIHIAYGEMADFLISVVRIESSFDPYAVNGNFVGFTQMGPAACKDVGIAYTDVKKYPWLNLEAGARYLKWYCMPVANGDRKEAYKRYHDGPYYDLVKPTIKRG